MAEYDFLRVSSHQSIDTDIPAKKSKLCFWFRFPGNEEYNYTISRNQVRGPS